jgi:hypothetical protein
MRYSKKIEKKKQDIANALAAYQNTPEFKKYERACKALSSLFANCPHEVTEPKQHYYGGSYDERARTNYWIECSDCGKTLKGSHREEVHSWYG